MANDDRKAWEEYRNMTKGNSFSPSRQLRAFTPALHPLQPVDRSYPVNVSSHTVGLAISPEMLTSLASHDQSVENERRFLGTVSQVIIPFLAESKTSGEGWDPDKSDNYHFGHRNDWNCPPSKIGHNHGFATAGSDFEGTSRYPQSVYCSRYFHSEMNLPSPQWHQSESHEGQLPVYHGERGPASRGYSYPHLSSTQFDGPASSGYGSPHLKSTQFDDIPRKDFNTQQLFGASSRKTHHPRLIKISAGVEVVLRGADEVRSYDRPGVRDRICSLSAIFG
jgi:hypothetical protein